MAKYQIGTATIAAAANAGIANLWAPATRSLRIIRIDYVINAATATTVSLTRTTTRGTQTTTATPQAIDPLASASTSTFDTAWSVQPTFSATRMGTYPLPASIGAGFTMVWDDADPLIVLAANGIALQNTGAAAASVGSVTFLFDEG
jgi:hypothetical protein